MEFSGIPYGPIRDMVFEWRILSLSSLSQNKMDQSFGLENQFHLCQFSPSALHGPVLGGPTPGRKRAPQNRQVGGRLAVGRW